MKGPHPVTTDAATLAAQLKDEQLRLESTRRYLEVLTDGADAPVPVEREAMDSVRREVQRREARVARLRSSLCALADDAESTS